MITIFTGKSIFSYLVLRRVMKEKNKFFVCISNTSTSSISNLRKIFQSTSFSYFIYRGLIQVFSLLPIFSIEKYLKKKFVNYEIISNRNDLLALDLKSEFGISLNFDCIIPEDVINKFPKGIINLHASNLPADKGISPVVWAYCRGDKNIICSYYLINEKLDDGEILDKKSIIINNNWSLFKTYCEILINASEHFVELIKSYQNGNKLVLQNHTKDIKASYNSWPDKKLHKLMKFHKRKYFVVGDIFYILGKFSQE